jgi:molecular chaperone GrpE (heat shock protein)
MEGPRDRIRTAARNYDGAKQRAEDDLDTAVDRAMDDIERDLAAGSDNFDEARQSIESAIAAGRERWLRLTLHGMGLAEANARAMARWLIEREASR